MNLDFTNMSTLIDTFIKRNKIKYPSSPAIIINEHKILSNLDLYNKIQSTIEIIESLNIPANSCIALRITDEVLYLILNLALFKMKISQTTLNPYNTFVQQLETINKVGVNLIIQDIPLDNILIKSTLFFDSNFNFKLNKSISESKNTLPKNTAVAFLGSGTTGEPKTIYIDDKKLAKRTKDAINIIPINKKDKIYNPSLLYYPFIRSITLISLINGASIILPKKRPSDIVKFCSKYKVNHCQMTVSQIYNSINNNNNNLNLHNMSSLLIYGSTVTEALRNKILKLLCKNLYIAYGSNEFGIITIANPEDLKININSLGKPIPKVSLKIVDDKFNECSIGESGNILVSSANVINKYLNNSKESYKSFYKNWFLPGDIGYLTKNGSLILEGRKDDMIIVSGVNIFPKEIESVLESHPNVQESIVTSIKNNNTSLETIIALTVLKNEIPEDKLLIYCQKILGWKTPKRIFITKEIPRNNLGKINKSEVIRKLKELF